MTDILASIDDAIAGHHELTDEIGQAHYRDAMDSVRDLLDGAYGAETFAWRAPEGQEVEATWHSWMNTWWDAPSSSPLAGLSIGPPLSHLVTADEAGLPAPEVYYVTPDGTRTRIPVENLRYDSRDGSIWRVNPQTQTRT